LAIVPQATSTAHENEQKEVALHEFHAELFIDVWETGSSGKVREAPYSSVQFGVFEGTFRGPITVQQTNFLLHHFILTD
jgi:hypothetical protein